MKIFSALLLLVMMISSSCKKEIIQNKSTPRTYDDLKSPEGGHIIITQGTILSFKRFFKESDLSSSQQSSQRSSTITSNLMSFTAMNDKETNSVHLEKDSSWIGDNAGRTFSGYTDEFLMLPAWSGQRDNFYLGSLIKGNSIASLEMIPLSERLGHYESRPISASISLPGKVVTGIFNPNELTTTEFYSKLLINNGLSNTQNAAYSFNYQEFTYYDELKQIFGSNANVGLLFFGSETSNGNDFHKISKNSGLAVKFTQKNFSLDMDIPEKGELYENLNLSAVDGYWPAYVSTITYGSTGVLVIESTENSTTLKSTYTKAFSVLGGAISGGSNLSSAEMNTINNSTMKIYFIGTNGAEAIKTIYSFDELVAFVKRGSTFTAQSPGVPISLKMKSLKDNKTINNTFKIDVPVKIIYPALDFEVNTSAKTNDLYVKFYADRELKIPVVAPARITFNIAGIARNLVMPGDIESEGISWAPFTINNTSHKTRALVFSNSGIGSPMYNPAFDTHAYLLRGTDYFGGNDPQVLSRSINYYSNLASEIMKKW